MNETMNIARIKRGGNTFEVVVHPELALKFKLGKESKPDIREALVFPQVYSDARKGMVASPSLLKSAFGTEDPVDAAKEIISKGDVNLTAEYKKNLQEQKRKQVIQIIHVNGIDPKTNLPHPAARIESALEQAKVKIDPFASAEEQARTVLKALRPILPIKFVVKEIQITVPPSAAGKAHGIVIRFGKIMRESWNNDGSWTGVVEVPGGLEADLYDHLNKAAHGNITAQLLRTNE